jgi:copper(I)-binding protein
MMTRSLALAIALVLGAGGASAHDYKVGNLEIDRPWSRATPKGAKVASGYVKITNSGSTPDRLIGGTFAPSRVVELHEMSVERGVMKMRELKGGLEIKPGATVELKPGSCSPISPVRSPRASA